jgi:AcrR family transcriptional regulator
LTANDRRKRPGRPSGASDTRDRILASARELFARNGISNTSIRAIAGDAGVDSALVHHYFGTKEKLFAAAVDIPIDPTEVLAVLRVTPVEDLGRTIPLVVLSLWESDLNARLKATLRSAIADNEVAMFGSFLRDIVLKQVAARLDDPPGSGILRAEFAASQILGAIMARHIFNLQPFASLPVEKVVNIIAPNLQRYLTGELPDLG